jgi:hypothetical protein
VMCEQVPDEVKTKMALTLTHVQTVGSKGAGELQFHTPWSVCETISGNIAVATGRAAGRAGRL